jgi:hypothetical protein
MFDRKYSDCSLCLAPPNRTVVRQCPDNSSSRIDERDDGNRCKQWKCSNNVTLSYNVTLNGTSYQIGSCVYTLTDCDDGNVCTNEYCDSSTGACVRTPIDCDDGNECTVDSCDARTGCIHTNFTLADCTAGKDTRCLTWSLDPSTPGCCVSQNISAVCSANVTDQCVSSQCRPGFGCVYGFVSCDGRFSNLGNCQLAECKSQSGCVITTVSGQIDKCSECDGTAATATDKCVGSLTVSEVAGLSAGIVALIIIIVVVVCIALGVIGGKVGMDYYKKHRGKMSGSQENPLYEDKGNNVDNPFYEERP